MREYRRSRARYWPGDWPNGKFGVVIPGWPEGPGPEPMNTGQSLNLAGRCSWFPGSRAAPAPRNDGMDLSPRLIEANGLKKAQARRIVEKGKGPWKRLA